VQAAREAFRASADRGQSFDRALVEDERLLRLALLRMQVGAEEEGAVMRGVRGQDSARSATASAVRPRAASVRARLNWAPASHGQRGTRTRGKKRRT
jgi:hypothetical protein